jgi:hypothetical protein
MKMDFFSDLSKELQRILKEFGLTAPTFEQLRLQDKRSDELKNKIENYDLRNLLLHFFTVYSRRVPVLKWKVHISDRLVDSKEISGIITKLSNGEDLNSLLSNRVSKLNQKKFADLLLSEWGIFHLHFDEKRSENLLFIYFSDANAYLIDILPHEKADGSVVTWTNTDLIQVMHDNWPSVLRPYIFKTKSESPVLTTEQRRTLRNKAANSTVIVNDGTEYMPMGGGYSASKHPANAVIKSDFLYQTVERLQFIVEKNHSAIQQALSSYTASPQLELKLGDNLEPVVIEVVHKIHVNLCEGGMDA